MASTVALHDEMKVALPQLKLLINNRWVASASGKTLRRLRLQHRKQGTQPDRGCGRQEVQLRDQLRRSRCQRAVDDSYRDSGLCLDRRCQLERSSDGL
jgi:hypothetical protein